MDTDILTMQRLRLREIVALEALDDSELESLARRCEWKELGPGEAIIIQDDQTDGVFFLCSGTAITTILSSDGREVAYERIPCGEVIGEIAALDGGPRSSYVMAETGCVVAVLPGEAFRTLVTTNAQICMAIYKRLCRTSRYLMNRLYNSQLVSMKDRIVMEVLKEAHQQAPGSNVVELASPPTHAELARRAGTHREAVTKHIASLRQAGLLGGARRQIIIPDLAALEATLESSDSRT